MKHIFALFFAAFYAGATCAQVTFGTSVYFASNAALVSEAAERSLDSVAQFVMAYDGAVALTAFADPRGSVEFNKSLAGARNAAVALYLKQAGVPAEVIKTIDFGKVEGVETTDEQSLGYYRRVDIVVTGIRKPTLVDGFRQQYVAENTQQFTISANQDTVLVAKRGTKISIKAGALRLPDGSVPVGNVSIEAIEAYDKTDWFANRLSTVSGDDLLESAGMVFIDAKVDGQHLQVDPNMPIKLAVPISGTAPVGMKLYHEQRLPDGTIEWQNPEDAVSMSMSPEDSLDMLLHDIVRKMYTTSLSLPELPPMPDVSLLKQVPQRVSFAGMKPSPPVKPDYEKVKKTLKVRRFSSKRKRLMAERRYNSLVIQYEKSIPGYEKKLAKWQVKADAAAAIGASNNVLEKQQDSLIALMLTYYKTYHQRLMLENTSVLLRERGDQAKYVAGAGMMNYIMWHIEERSLQDACQCEPRHNSTQSHIRSFDILFPDINKDKIFKDRQPNLDALQHDVRRKVVSSYKEHGIMNLSKDLAAVLGNDTLQEDLLWWVDMPIQKTAKVDLPNFPSSYKGKSTVAAAINEAAYFMADVVNLGRWVNLDYPIFSIPVQPQEIEIIDPNPSLEVYVMVNDFNTMTPIRYKNGKYTSHKIPEMAPITIISIKEEGGQMMCARQSHVVRRNNIINLQYRAVSREELRATFR